MNGFQESPMCEDAPIVKVIILTKKEKNIKRKKRAAGMGCLNDKGYILINSNGKLKREHRVIVERVLGKEISFDVIIHHVNENRADNRNCNLVVCQDREYHKLLHIRMEAIRAGFPAYYRKCSFCKKYDHPDNLYIFKKGNLNKLSYHRECSNAYLRKWKLNRESIHREYEIEE